QIILVLDAAFHFHLTRTGQPRRLCCSHRSGGSRCRWRDRGSRRSSRTTANLQLYLALAVWRQLRDQFANTSQKLIAHPILDEAVGGHQAQVLIITSGSEGSDPRVELLGGKLILQILDTFLPREFRQGLSPGF